MKFCLHKLDGDGGECDDASTYINLDKKLKCYEYDAV